LYTAFVGVLGPSYWASYGPANFLWFSDVALFVTLAALWLESPFLASMQAVSVVFLELVWVADFLVRLLSGVQVVGLSSYMFDPGLPAYLRGLSLFHLVLPFLLLWLVWRLGYDRRAWLAQAAAALVVLRRGATSSPTRRQTSTGCGARGKGHKRGCRRACTWRC